MKPHISSFESLDKGELHALCDRLVSDDPEAVEESIAFLEADTKGIWHGRARAMMARRGVSPLGSMRLLTLFALTLLMAGCNDKAARSSDDIIICKQFYAEALMRMDDLKRQTFRPGDLTFEQLRTLTPRDPDWRDAQFLVLSAEWGRTNEAKRIVIVCGQSRVSESGQRVHCVGYSTGETAWLAESEIATLQLRDFTVLPKIRP